MATLPAITEIHVVQCVFPHVMLGGEERTKAESFIFFACLGNEILLLNFTLPFLLLIFFFFFLQWLPFKRLTKLH